MVNSYIHLFQQHGIIKDGHFKLTSGRHGGRYINKDRIWSNFEVYDTIIAELTEIVQRIQCKVGPVQFITGPAAAGAILASPVARETRRPFVYPEKKDGRMIFRRGFDGFICGKKGVIIEDIITTGSSTMDTVRAVEENGGQAAGVACIWNRIGEDVMQQLGRSDISFQGVINQRLPNYDPGSCPMCDKGEPLIDPKTGEILS